MVYAKRVYELVVRRTLSLGVSGRDSDVCQMYVTGSV